MTERVISYLILAAATVAVLLVAVVQPHNTAVEKRRMQESLSPFLADSCTASGMGMTCEEYTAMMAAMTACTSQQGYSWVNGVCTPPATSCNGQSCNAMTCQAAGYAWDAETQLCLTGGSAASSGGTSGAPAPVGGTSANERLSQRIESACLAHVEQSGYAPVIKKYGWFNNVRVYANNACTYAYLATNGKFSSNNDLYLVSGLVANDAATRTEDIGLLYAALENAPTQKSGQSLDDYVDAGKDGVAKYLKDVMDIMAEFNDRSSTPAYLANPLPYVTAAAGAEWNKANGTKIVSLEEKFLALLPKAEGAAAEEPEESQAEKTVEEPKKIEIAEPAPTETPAAEEAPSMGQRVAAVLTKIVNKLKGIREEGMEKGIERRAVTPDLGELQKDFLHTQEIIETFDACRTDGVC